MTRQPRQIGRALTALTIVLMTLVLAATGCGGDEETGGTEAGGGGGEPYRIGIFAPLTGFAASDGKSAVDSARLAVDQLNARGGVNGRKLELAVFDDASKPDQAATIARKLTGRDTHLVVSGSYSAQTRAAAPVIARADKLLIAAYAVDPQITQVGEQVWRIGELASVQGKVGGKLVLDNLKARRVAVLAVDNDFGTALAGSFGEYVRQNGGRIVYESKYALDEDNFRTVLGAIKGRRPDVLYAPGYYNNAANIANQAAEVGLEAQIVGVEGYDSPKLLELAGDNANGIIFTTELDRDSDNPAVQRFLREYQRRTGREADAVGAETYDAVLVAARALARAPDGETEQLIAALERTGAVEDSVTEITGFSPQRNAIRAGLAQVVRNGEFRRYARFEDRELITPP